MTPSDSPTELTSAAEARVIDPVAMPQYVVRTGAVRSLSVMQASQAYGYGDRVVARTDRGTEFGVVLCEATPAAVSQLEEPTSGRILRPMNADDERQWQIQQNRSGDDSILCARLVQELGLAMQVVDVERLLGGERIVFYFLSENRVDFRGLVKRLADELQTRIEMRQIGVRDEAKLLESPSAATRISRRCPRCRCGWQSCRKRRWTRLKSRADAVGLNVACDTNSIPTKRCSEICRQLAAGW